MFCKKCGTQIADDASFCEKCGSKIKVKSLDQNNKVKEEIQKKPLPLGAIIFALLFIIGIPVEILLGALKLTGYFYILDVIVTLVLLFGIFTQKRWLPTAIKIWFALLVVFSILGIIWIFISPLIGPIFAAFIPEQIRTMLGINVSLDYSKVLGQAVLHFIIDFIPNLIQAIIFIWYFSSRKKYFYN